MASHCDPTQSCVLQVTITHLKYSVTEKILGQLFDAYGVHDLCVLHKSTHMEVFVEFQSWLEASQAKAALHGRCIYDGCCLLDIQRAPQSISIITLPNSKSIVVDFDCVEMADQVELEPLVSAPTPSASTPARHSAKITSMAASEPAPHDTASSTVIDVAKASEVEDVLPSSTSCISIVTASCSVLCLHNNCDKLSCAFMPRAAPSITHQVQVHGSTTWLFPSLDRCLRGSRVPRPLPWPSFMCDQGGVWLAFPGPTSEGAGTLQCLQPKTPWEAQSELHVANISGTPMLGQILDKHHKFEQEIDVPICLDHGVSGTGLVFFVVQSAQGKRQLLLSREMLHGTYIATLFIPWVRGAWIIFAEMCNMLILRAQAHATAREGTPLQCFTRQFLSQGQGDSQFNKITAIADLCLNHGLKDCFLLGALHSIPFTCVLLESLEACPGPEVNHDRKHLVGLAFEHIQEQYKGSYKLISGTLVICSCGAITCWYESVYVSEREWDLGIVQFILGTLLSIIGTILHISIAFTTVYCELDSVQQVSSSAPECFGDGSVKRFYIQLNVFLQISRAEIHPQPQGTIATVVMWLHVQNTTKLLGGSHVAWHLSFVPCPIGKSTFMQPREQQWPRSDLQIVNNLHAIILRWFSFVSKSQTAHLATRSWATDITIIILLRGTFRMFSFQVISLGNLRVLEIYFLHPQWCSNQTKWNLSRTGHQFSNELKNDIGVLNPLCRTTLYIGDALYNPCAAPITDGVRDYLDDNVAAIIATRRRASVDIQLLQTMHIWTSHGCPGGTHHSWDLMFLGSNQQGLSSEDSFLGQYRVCRQTDYTPVATGYWSATVVLPVQTPWDPGGYAIPSYHVIGLRTSRNLRGRECHASWVMTLRSNWALLRKGLWCLGLAQLQESVAMLISQGNSTSEGSKENEPSLIPPVLLCFSPPASDSPSPCLLISHL